MCYNFVYVKAWNYLFLKHTLCLITVRIFTINHHIFFTFSIMHSIKCREQVECLPPLANETLLPILEDLSSLLESFPTQTQHVGLIVSDDEFLVLHFPWPFLTSHPTGSSLTCTLIFFSAFLCYSSVMTLILGISILYLDFEICLL